MDTDDWQTVVDLLVAGGTHDLSCLLVGDVGVNDEDEPHASALSLEGLSVRHVGGMVEAGGALTALPVPRLILHPAVDLRPGRSQPPVCRRRHHWGCQRVRVGLLAVERR
ncbi:MAG: hypothetical protein WAU02_01920 [Candidatus Saccharimonadales bacterium]